MNFIETNHSYAEMQSLTKFAFTVAAAIVCGALKKVYDKNKWIYAENQKKQKIDRLRNQRDIYCSTPGGRWFYRDEIKEINCKLDDFLK